MFFLTMFSTCRKKNVLYLYTSILIQNKLNILFFFSACRYDKGTWSECVTGQMQRSDKLKSTSDPACQATREVNKNCNAGKTKGDKKDRASKKGKQDLGNFKF